MFIVQVFLETDPLSRYFYWEDGIEKAVHQ